VVPTIDHQPPDGQRAVRARPDLAGRTATGELFLGEAELGPELFQDDSQEQLSGFLSYAPDGIPVALHLIVPWGWRETAEAAARPAVGATDRLEVHELAHLPRGTSAAKWLTRLPDLAARGPTARTPCASPACPATAPRRRSAGRP
jgi:hypothetical protein